jgi:phosphate transport system permease protein
VRSGHLVLGSSDGRAALGSMQFEATWQGSERVVTPQVTWRATAVLDSAGAALVRVAGDRDADGQVALAGMSAERGLSYALVDAAGSPAAAAHLATSMPGRTPVSVTVSLHGALLAAGTDDGTLFLWDLADPAAPKLEDHTHAAESGVTALRMLLGDQSLVVGTARGEVAQWFRVRYVRARNDSDRSIELEGKTLAPGESRVVLDRNYARQFAHVPGVRFLTEGQPWTRIRSFEPHPAAVVAIAPSPRNKVFATADAQGGVHLQHATSHRTLLELAASAPGAVRGLVFAPKSDRLLALDANGKLQMWKIDNPHPEAGVEALFGAVWYEGYVEPKHVWQSTGGSDEFEPKLGLVPLLVGTFKGTLYTMLFSVPVAILAALYLSQLASPGLRNVVKPVIELMAAMPSVVVGFLAALWLAPLLERNLTSFAAAALAIPFGLAAAIGCWYLLPLDWRQRAKPGVELAFLVPFLIAAAWAGSRLGEPIQNAWFGGDLQQWLFDHHGIHYDQRNCIVVGIALGFAVIPIVFTICEDAMSAVPRSLTSAALALGASRWQSARHVVLPAASPGIFAAIMLGLGRAIGETMIVLMATGNTPILDLTPLSGMRTMSACIAVEIPEAPYGGTLYRILFLTGALLFVFTFLLNTAADVVSRRLRKRYGQF